MPVFEDDQSLLAITACGGCPYRRLGMCGGASRPQDFKNRRRQRIGCLEPDRQMEYFLAFYGHIPARTLTPPAIPQLPAFIAQLPTRGIPPGCDLPSEHRIYAVSFSSICSHRGRLRYTDPGDLRRSLGVPVDSNLALIGTGSDKLLEKFWRRSEKLSSWKTLAALRFTFATTLSFSVWDDDPRFDQIFNLERNRATFELLTDVGIPTIPFLFEDGDLDITYWRKWLKERPSIETIALLAQFYRSEERFHDFLGLARELRRALPRGFRFLVVGCSTPERLRQVYRRLPGSTVVTGTPVIRGLNGRGVDHHLRFSYLPLLDPASLVRGNLLEYEEFCRRAA